MAVPQDDPNWDYQSGRPGQAPRNHVIACLIVGLQKAGYKVVNFDKLWEITKIDENPAQFLAKLMEALQKYAKLDPTSAEGTIVLSAYFTPNQPQISKINEKKKKRHKKALKPLNKTF